MATVDLGGWLDHWSRVGRWHARLEEICQGIPAGTNPARSQDDVLAFFVFCYHLSDALERGGFGTKAEIKKYVEGNDALALCRDLAIAVKHFEVTTPYLKTTYIGTAAEPRVVLSGVPPPCEPMPGQQWVVETDAGKKDVFRLADECIEAWSGYLQSLKLPPE